MSARKGKNYKPVTHSPNSRKNLDTSNALNITELSDFGESTTRGGGGKGGAVGTPYISGRESTSSRAYSGGHRTPRSNIDVDEDVDDSETKSWSDMITSINISEFKKFQTDLRKNPSKVDINVDVVPSFFNHTLQNIGSSGIWEDHQWTYYDADHEVFSCLNTACGYYIITASRDMHLAIFHQYKHYSSLGGARKCAKRWKAHGGPILRVIMDSHDRFIFSCSFDKTIKIWQLKKTPDRLEGVDQFKSLMGHEDHVYDIALSPDEKTLASCGADKNIFLWNWFDGVKVMTFLRGHQDTIRSLAWSDDGRKVVSGSQDAFVNIWDARNGCVLKQLEGHSTHVLCCACKGNKIISGSSDMSIIVWNLEEEELISVLKFHSANVESVQFVPGSSNKILSASLDQTIRVINIETEQQEYIIEGHAAGVYDAVFSRDLRFVISAGADKTVRLTKVEIDRLEVNKPNFHTGIIWACNFSPMTDRLKKEAQRGYFLTSGEDRQVIIWDAYTVRTKYYLRGHTNHVTRAEFCPDMEHVVSCSFDGTFKIWKFREQKCISDTEDHNKGTIWYIDVRKDNAFLATAGVSSTINIWDITTKEKPSKITELTGHSHDTVCVKWHPNDPQILLSSSSDCDIKVWNFNRKKCLKTISGHRSVIYHIVFIDSMYFATSSMDHTIRVWDLHSGRTQDVLEGHNQPVISLVVTPDRKKLISGGRDSMICIWDIASGMLLERYKAHRTWIRCVAIDPWCERILSVSDDSCVKIWRIPNLLYRSQPLYDKRILSNPAILAKVFEVDPTTLVQATYKSDFTILHALAFYGNQVGVKLCFKNAKRLPEQLIPFIKDISGRTPLHYSHEKNNDHITEYFLNVLKPYPPKLVETFIDIFPEMISRRYENMATFIDSRLLPPIKNLRRIPVFSAAVDQPRRYHGGNTKELEDYKMLATPKANLDSQTVPISIRLLYIENIMSLRMFKAIIGSKDPRLFKSRALQSMLTYKWDQYAKKEFLAEFLIFSIYMLLFIVFSIAIAFKTKSIEDEWKWIEDFTWVVIGPLILMNSIYAFQEFKQMIAEDIKHYFESIWNVLDVLLILGTYFSCFFNIMVEEDEMDNNYLLSFLAFNTLLFWIRLLSLTRGFRSIGTMVRMILEMIYDIRAFLVILLIAVMGFGHTFYLAQKDTDRDEDLTLQLTNLYKLAFTAFDTTDYQAVEWIFFFLATFFIIIILLNMLIAIMADTFTRIKDVNEETGFLEWGLWIYDKDLLMSKRHKGRWCPPKYLYIAAPLEGGHTGPVTLQTISSKLDDIRDEIRLLRSK